MNYIWSAALLGTLSLISMYVGYYLGKHTK